MLGPEKKPRRIQSVGYVYHQRNIYKAKEETTQFGVIFLKEHLENSAVAKLFVGSLNVMNVITSPSWSTASRTLNAILYFPHFITVITYNVLFPNVMHKIAIKSAPMREKKILQKARTRSFYLHS